MSHTRRKKPAGFGTESANHALTDACVQVGLSATSAKLMRLGENAIFHLIDNGVVVRIARSMDYMNDAEKEVNVSEWLTENSFPAAAVIDLPQPIVALGHPVTFWHYISGRPGDQRDIVTLALTLRRLHELPRPKTFTLPQEDILGRVESRVEIAPVKSEDKQFLLSHLANLRQEIAELEFPLSEAPTHGDAHSENLMIHDGEAILIDFERFAWGQPEWDLAMTATEYSSAGWWTDAEYRAFADAYGFDVMNWDGFKTLKSVHELKMTTWLMQNVEESSEIEEEYQVRMRTIRDEIPAKWRPF